MIAYADKVKVLCSNCSAAEVGRHIDELAATNVGGGNSAHPFDKILDLASRSDMRVFEITLTDGCWYCTDDAIASAKKCMKKDIGCISVGFGSADHDFLKMISSMDEAALMSSVDGLAATFSTIATTISSGGYKSIR